MAPCTASVLRSSVVLLCGAAIWAQDSTADRVKSLEHELKQQKRTLRDYGGLIRYGSENSELPPPAMGENRVIFLGDQITEYWNREHFPGKPWLNRGIAGQTTDQMLVRFRQDVVSLQPKAVVILGGLNDIAGLHGSPSSEEMVADNLMSMTEIARANGIRVVLASLTPICNCYSRSAARERWQERIMELNELIEKYCSKSGATFLDYFQAMSEKGDLKKELTNDGTIPNEAGYAVMARLAEKAIDEALHGGVQ
ncbi:MAG TPA: GDSL-type esterase/lipase family protein [Bryobacteraceae bacterium]|nr:GDSL-type esterase/lipase family protein [Bryobacteraceae bacterium]